MRYNRLMGSTHLSVRDLNLPPDFWESKKVDLSNLKLDSLDGCPDKVLSDFLCWRNNLASLAGGPKIVGGGFNCSDNLLTSLALAPTIVVGDFSCSDNHLTSLVNAPTNVCGNFACSNNHLTSLADIHTHVQKINGELYIGGNPITSHLLGILLIQGCQGVVSDSNIGKKAKLLQQAVDILNKYVNKGRAGIMDCQAEMLAAGLDDFAQI